MKKSKIGLLLIALCLSAMLYAQGNYVPGYVITNQQDTVVGLINTSEQTKIIKNNVNSSRI